MNLPLRLSQKLRPFSDKSFLLAVSGGKDSVALFHLFLHLKKHFDFQFSVAHFHHGPCEDSLQQEFRFVAFELVKSLCAVQDIGFYSNYDGQDSDGFVNSFENPLKSESQCREARYDFFDSLLSQYEFDLLVLAHHSQDLLETRLIKMIRGVGPQGLASFEFLWENRLRPLLDVSPDELLEFLRVQKAEWIDDPSNKDPELGLRNWLRHSWLLDLENQRPGAVGSLGRSLDLLVASLPESVSLETYVDDKGLILSEWHMLSPEQQRSVMAAYMKGQGLKNFGLSHINEVIKRLDTERKHHTFKLLGRCWIVDAGRMNLREPS